MFKRNERPNYWNETLRSLKGFAIAMGVSLVFYLSHIPHLHGLHEHLRSLRICGIFGAVIYSCIWTLYKIQWTILHWQNGKNEAAIKIPPSSHFFLGSGGAAIGLFLSLHIESWLNGEPFTFSQFWESLIISTFIALMFQFYYANKYSRQENLRLKAAKAEAELHALRNQMQPHFLFNSLNSLAALIDSDPATAGEATQKLADLYRLILDCSKSQLSPLKRELRIVKLYLEIEKIRYGKRLNFLLPVLSPAESDLAVPSLILQTLVENAVKHGIAGNVEGGYVHLSVLPLSETFRVEVVNSGAELPRQSGNGTGLRNTIERLALVYGPGHNFQLATNGEGLTCASFLIPRKT